MLRPVLLVLFWLLGIPALANPVRFVSASGSRVTVRAEGFTPNSEVQVGVGLRRVRSSLFISQDGMSFYRFTPPEGATAVRLLGQPNWTVLSLVVDRTPNLRVSSQSPRQFLARVPEQFWSSFVPQSPGGFMKVGRSFFYRGNGDPSVLLEFNVQAYRLAKADQCGRISVVAPVSGPRAISSLTIGQASYTVDSLPAGRLSDCP